MPQSFRLTPAKEADQSFLFELYVSVREQEVAGWGWSVEETEGFLKMQWNMQLRSYEMQFPSASCYIIELEGQKAGRCLIVREVDHIRVIDIGLVPRFRNQGLGTSVIKQLQSEAENRRIPLLLSVSGVNPARRLYERLGFLETGSMGTHVSMQWLP